jgi:pimeloyl-ACP methyl ester carboxylesterase
MRKFYLNTLLCALILCCDSNQIGNAVSFDGVKIAYEMGGKGEPTLVFIHGWCCDRTYWSHQFDYFAKKYRVLAIDLAGHGESNGDRSNWSMPAYAEDIAAVVKKLKVNKIVLIGHSAGAFAALAGANLLLDQTVGVIGADGFRIGSETYLERRFNNEYLQDISNGFSDDFAKDMTESVSRWFLPESDTTLINWVTRDMGMTPRDVAIPAAQAYYKYRNGGLQNALKTVGNNIPIIEIKAGDKGKVAIEHIREYAPLFDVVYLYGVGHFLMMENPEAFNFILEKQLKKLL